MPARVKFGLMADDTGVRVALTVVIGESTFVLPFEKDEADELKEGLSAAIRQLIGVQEEIAQEDEPPAKC